MISREEFEALRASHELLRSTVQRSAIRAILRERQQTQAAMDTRLKRGTLTGAKWDTRSRQPDPPQIGTALLDRMNDVISEGRGVGAMDEEPGAPFYDLMVGHLPNGSFSLPPPLPDDDITNINPLPGRWELVRTGTAITARSVVGGAAGRHIDFTMAAGAAGDELLLERIIRIPPSTFGRSPVAVIVEAQSADFISAQLRIKAQFLQDDMETTTGAEATQNIALNALDLPNVLTLYPEDGATPTDAAYLRVRVGMNRAGATTGTTGTLSLYAVRLTLGVDVSLFPNLNDPFGSTGVEPGAIYKTVGSMWLWQTLASGGSGIELGDDIAFTPVDDAQFFLSSGGVKVSASEGLQIGDVGTTPTPPPGFYAVYAKPDGELYGQNAAGTEVPISGGTGGASRAFAFFMGG